MRHDAESLRAEFATAFARREYPGDDHVAYQREGCVGYEGNEARDWLRGRTWRDLLAEGMGIEHRDYVHFLRPEGYLYYFPALATFALDLDHPAEMDETLLTRLAWKPHEVAALVTPEERWAIVHLLEYLAEAHAARGYAGDVAEHALDSFWRDFQPEEPDGGDPPPSTASQETGDVPS